GYDCSGLVQAAWAQAGVNLPRTTYDQVNAGTRVSRDQVRPGDLLFFYSESAPSHVGIYSGNGSMIHGSNPSKPLEEVSLAAYWDSVFTGAVRVGWKRRVRAHLRWPDYVFFEPWDVFCSRSPRVLLP